MGNWAGAEVVEGNFAKAIAHCCWGFGTANGLPSVAGRESGGSLRMWRARGGIRRFRPFRLARKCHVIRWARDESARHKRDDTAAVSEGCAEGSVCLLAPPGAAVPPSLTAPAASSAPTGTRCAAGRCSWERTQSAKKRVQPVGREDQKRPSPTARGRSGLVFIAPAAVAGVALSRR